MAEDFSDSVLGGLLFVIAGILIMDYPYFVHKFFVWKEKRDRRRKEAGKVG